MANEVNNEGVKTPEDRLSDLLAEIMKIQRSAKESSDVTELYKEIDRISEELKSVVEASSVKENTAMIDAVNGFLFSESYKALDHAWTLISEGLGNLYSDDEIREYLAGLEDVEVLKKQYILSSLDKNFSDANSCMLAYNVKKCNEMLQSGKIDDFVNRQADQGDIIKKCMESGVSRNQIAEILKNPDVVFGIQNVDNNLSKEKEVIQSDSPSEKSPVKAKMAPISDDILSQFSSGPSKPSESEEYARQIAIDLLKYCNLGEIVESEKLVGIATQSIRGSAFLLREEPGFNDWSKHETAFENVESTLSDIVKSLYNDFSKKDEFDIDDFMGLLSKSDMLLRKEIRTFEKTGKQQSSNDGNPIQNMSADEDYTDESRKRALYLLGYDTVTYENRDAVDMVRNKIDFALQIIQEQDAYKEFVSEFPDEGDYLGTDFENSIRSVLLNRRKAVTPENITKDVIMAAVNSYCDMISQKLDEKKGLENEHSQDDEKSPGNWRGYDFEIPMESIERTELSGEPEDPLYGYRQIAMCVLGYTKADRNNISEILDMELELFKKRETDRGEYGEEVNESSYDDVFDEIYDYYQKADGYLARAVGIVKKIKRSASEVEHSRSERALKKKEEKMQKAAAKEMQKKEREKIKQAKAEEVKKLRALQQEALEQKKASLQRVAQQQDDMARRIHPELFNPSSPDTFVMPDEYKDKKSKR